MRCRITATASESLLGRLCRIGHMPDPSTCDHEWVDDGMLEIHPPVSTSHCVKCGLRRHINSGSGAVTYYPPTASREPSKTVANRPSGDRDE